MKQSADRVILVVAHLIREKGVEHLLRAVAKLGDPTVRVTVAGDGPEEARLRALAAAEGLGSRVEFTGLRDDVSALLAGADVFVHPAVWAEAFGWTIAEAMAAGCPVIASRIGGIPELVVDGETGLLVPPGDDIAIAAALRRLLNEPDLCQRLAARARRRAEELFSLSACAARHIDWCEAATRSRRRRSAPRPAPWS